MRRLGDLDVTVRVALSAEVCSNLARARRVVDAMSWLETELEKAYEIMTQQLGGGQGL